MEAETTHVHEEEVTRTKTVHGTDPVDGAACGVDDGFTWRAACEKCADANWVGASATAQKRPSTKNRPSLVPIQIVNRVSRMLSVVLRFEAL